VSAARRGARVKVYADPITRTQPAEVGTVRRVLDDVGEWEGRVLRRYELRVAGVGVVERFVLDEDWDGGAS
jgi:hypothetical protein